MYEPCEHCVNRYDRPFSDWCKKNCAYAIAVKDRGEYMHELSKYRTAVAEANDRLALMLRELGVEEG